MGTEEQGVVKEPHTNDSFSDEAVEEAISVHQSDSDNLGPNLTCYRLKWQPEVDIRYTFVNQSTRENKTKYKTQKQRIKIAK